MNAIERIREIGADVKPGPGGKLTVTGLKELPKELADRAVSIARNHKQEILNELLKPRPVLPDGLCLMGPCEHGRYKHEDHGGRYVPVLFCRLADSSVYGLKACPSFRWRKDEEGRPVGLQ